MIALLTRRDLLRNTVVVVVGDHGEHFAVDGATSFGHGSTINENDTHVPLIVRTPAPPADASSKLLRAQEGAVMSLAAVPSIVSSALGSTISSRVHAGSDARAGLILSGQQIGAAAIAANLYGTLIGTVRQRPNGGDDERCVRSTGYAKFFSGSCNSASRDRLEEYFSALTELYANTFDTGGCRAGTLSC